MKLFLSILLLQPTLFLSAATYYVSNTGNDGANGTSTGAPWQTIGHVNGVTLHAGDTVLLQRGGVWRGDPIDLYLSPSGTSGNPITFSAYGTGARPQIVESVVVSGFTLVSGTVYAVAMATQPQQIFGNQVRVTRNWGAGSGVTSGQWDWVTGTLYLNIGANPSTETIEYSDSGAWAVYLPATSYITIDSLDLERGEYGVYAGGGDTNLTFTNNLASNNYQIGIEVNDGSLSQTGLVVQGNETSYNGGAGIDYTGHSQLGLITHNYSHNNAAITYNSSFSPISQANAAGIKIWGQTTDMQNVVISYNTVAFNGLAGQPLTGSGTGIWIDESLSGNSVLNNNVHDNTVAGIYNEATSDTTIMWNVSANNNTTAGGAGIELYRYGSNNLVSQNTVYGNIVGISVQGTTGEGSGNFINNSITNNLVTNSSTAELQAITGGNNVSGSSGNTYTFNGFGAAASNFIIWGASDYSTYAAWETATGSCGTSGCSSSLQSTPAFVNTVASDYRLVRGSAALTASSGGSFIGDFGVVEPSILSGVSASAGAGVFH